VTPELPTADDEIVFLLPDTPADLPAGPYQVAVEVQRPGEPLPRVSNSLPLLVAPRITSTLPFSVTRDAEGAATLQLSCSPEVRPAQRATLVVGEREVLAAPHPNQTANLTFIVVEAAPGDHLLRLRIDGVESVLANRETVPPSFDLTQKVNIA
jgi:hypothetical protein